LSVVQLSIRYCAVRDPVTINIDEIKQDEPTDGTGDGHICPDGDDVGTSTAQVRAERSATLLGGGNGRVYTIYFTASDGKGGTCEGSVTVRVPRTGNGSATNGGALYDSTECAGALLLEGRDDQRAVHGPSAAEAEPAAWENYCLLDALLHEVLNDPLCLP
jgi:hypothetical protein